MRKLSTWRQGKQQNPEITGTIAYVGNGGPRFFLILTMPLVIVGAVVGLIAMQADFGFMVILGLSTGLRRAPE